ncbi:MAG: RluA family pseudouridine synthase [Kiritimatiellae bacterium]|jgi:23S rRNA pseudouridine1911/1915/1917 synthase|nr:RluA family pseudouridine synthase [Kiritimatiellia bacterium]MBQ3746762.1 RluA family pseudouridine synthase [Kiritimatiellia bacterium]
MNPSELDIIYEDEAIAVVDKPSGVIVHPAPGHETGALTDALVRRFPGMARVGSAERPGVVHRLDIETSGVMVFAKTQGAYLDLRRQFESHRTVGKTYLAVVHGSPRPKSGTIDEPVGRERQSAVTHWETLGRHDGISLVEFKIDTGRMHQIRIHAASLGCPIVGDRLYGSAEKDRRMRRRPSRLLLHAVELSFLHPVTHRRVTFAAPPPDDIVYA